MSLRSGDVIENVVMSWRQQVWCMVGTFTLLIAGGRLSAYHANIKLAQLCQKELQLICLHTCSVYQRHDWLVNS